MLKKTITFEDLDGNKLTEDFYFNLSKAEVAEMELSHKGGLSEYIKKIIETQDAKELIAIFKDLIALSVGERSEDGRKFVKNDEIRNNFMQTDAYSELFVELATQADAAATFMNGIVPAGLQEEMAKVSAQAESPIKVENVALPAPVITTEKVLPKDPSEMSVEELREAFRQKNGE